MLRLSSTQIGSSYQLSCCNQLTLITCVAVCVYVYEREIVCVMSFRLFLRLPLGCAVSQKQVSTLPDK